MSRIAIISEHASPLALLGGTDAGGQNVYVGQIARRLASRGHEVDVFTRRDDPSLPPTARWGAASVVHVPAGPARPIPKERLLDHMDEFTRRLSRHIRRTGLYDVVHANFFMSGLVAAELKCEFGTPFVITFHALGRVRRLHQKKADAFPAQRLRIEDRIVANADRILAECPQDRDDLISLYGADPTRLSAVPCGFDPDEFAIRSRRKARRSLGLNSTEFLILQLGRMVPRKGVDNVIRAVARLRHDHGVAARLLVVGGETRRPDPSMTPEIGRLQSIAHDEGIASAVTFLGSRRRDELAEYYAAADVFATTPWYEPFGITPLEAMACGRPVVGAAVGGIRYTVRDGETGFLVPPRDPVALADRFARLHAQPELAARMGRAGARRARGSFTWERIVDKVERVYARVATPALLHRTR